MKCGSGFLRIFGALLISMNVFADVPPQFGRPTGPGPATRFSEKPAFGTVQVGSGFQHRIVLYRTGESKWYYGAHNSTFNQINTGRLVALEALIEQLKPGPLVLQSGQASCDAHSTDLTVYKKDGTAVQIDQISECKHMSLPGRDPRLQDLLIGLLAIGDLNIPQ